MSSLHPSNLASCAISGGSAFKSALEGIFFGFGTDKKAAPTPIKWGVMPACNLIEERCRHWIELIGAGQSCRGFIVVDDRDQEKVWATPFAQHRFLSPYLEKIPCATNLKELCAGLSGEPESLPLGSIRRYVEAIWLQTLVQQFSHGSNGDVVNGFLAPARLLKSGEERTLQWAIWKDFWVPFKTQVLTGEIAGLQIGKELVDACSPITAWVENAQNLSLNDGDLERVMMLLTQIRTLADQRSREDSNSPRDDKVYSLGSEGQFKLLVVDDHAATWHPVFESLLKALKGKLDNQNLQIDFSLDGKSLAGSSKNVLFGSYDVVLLDIFLGRDSGTDLLKKLRRDFSQLPVLLWTTSRDEEITGAARLANGILLKKSVTRADLVASLGEWLVRGRSLRSKTLPSPFFHHTIQSPDLRELAVDFHEWCLKQLDSFHALDSSFFRYFTNHGGRHIVKLWELLGKALESFLHDDETLLPKIDETKPETIRQREIEITGLYLTVICHELGMFPMRVGKQVENFADLPKAYLKDVRSLHALRGMALIEDHACGYWNDTAGKELGLRLHHRTFGDLPFRLAALSGYHARVFGSLSSKLFLALDRTDSNSVQTIPKHISDLEDRINKLESTSSALSQSGGVFKQALTRIGEEISDPVTRERLRRQCALFRFVDALDVSFTRNPPEFLALHGKLPAKQYRENLKREVCTSAAIDDGEVKVVLRVEAPEVDLVRNIAKHLCGKRIGDKTAIKKAIKALRNDTVVSEPWQLPAGESSWQINQLDTVSAICLQKPLDEWLERVWELMVDGKGSAEFIQHLRDLAILDNNALDPTLTTDGAIKIASITALSVAGELLDEYRAIVEADLAEKIKINAAGWKWACGGNPHDFPSLRRFLPKEAERSADRRVSCR